MKYKLIEHNTDAQKNWCNHDDTREYLLLNGVYDATVEIDTWHTHIIIDGRKYNSLCFKKVVVTINEFAVKMLRITLKYPYVDDPITFDDFVDELYDLANEVLSDEDIHEVLNG